MSAREVMDAGPVPGVTLRPATQGDSHRVWVWRNDPETRQASFDSDPISLDAHEAWFRESLVREDRKLYVILANGVESGTARLDLSGGEAEVSIHLAPESRYRGVGTAALRALIDVGLGALGLRRLVGHIKSDNQASLAAFSKAGFALIHGPDVVTAIKTRQTDALP